MNNYKDLFNRIERDKVRNDYKFLFLNLINKSNSRLKIYKRVLNKDGFQLKFCVIAPNCIEILKYHIVCNNTTNKNKYQIEYKKV